MNNYKHHINVVTKIRNTKFYFSHIIYSNADNCYMIRSETPTHYGSIGIGWYSTNDYMRVLLEVY